MSITTEGKITAGKGYATQLSSDYSSQPTGLNAGFFIAGQTNTPENNVVYGGVHVGFSNNYAVQFVGRNSKFYAQTIENGTLKGWKKLLTSDDLASVPTMSDGKLKVLGTNTDRSEMDCRMVGYDSTGKSMSWAIGQYSTVPYRVYFEDYLASEGIELNGDNGSVKLYTGGQTTGTPAEIVIYDDQCLSTVNYTIKPASSSWDRYFTMENSGTAYHNGTYQFWGNAVYDGSNITGDRYSVFEWKLDTGYLAYLERSADGSQKLQVNGGILCTAVTQSSDRDLKDNIEVIPDATAAIRKMNGYTYTLKENGLPYAGIIAQEAMEAIPEAVGSFMWEGEELEGPTQDGRELRETARYLNVDYAAVTGLLVQVARETDDRVTALEEENASLRANIAVMDERITKLEALVQQLTGSEE
ncbi:tail fiber domain-containing protein [Escherichia coli]